MDSNLIFQGKGSPGFFENGLTQEAAKGTRDEQKKDSFQVMGNIEIIYASSSKFETNVAPQNKKQTMF